MRQHWVVLLAIVAGAVFLSASALFIENHDLRWFFLGAWTAGTAGFVWHFVIVASGSALFLMGNQGEQWTRQELRRAQRRGWKVIHRVLFRGNEDIDTIMIGPPGAVVIETKWASESWSSPRQQKWLRSAVEQVTGNSALIDKQLRQRIGPLETRAVVALWPADRDMPTQEIDGVTVLPGTELDAWVNSLTGADLTESKVQDAWSFISEHLEKRDASDAVRHGPAPRSVGKYLADVAQYPVGVLLGVMSVAALVATFEWPGALIPGALLAGAAAVIRSFEPIHRFMTAFLVAAGSLLITLVILGLTYF